MDENLISLDPRVHRLPAVNVNVVISTSDQLSSFEVFIQAKEEKPFQHEGAVRAGDLDYAFILAKETFSRRFTCVDLFVVATNNIVVSEFTEGSDNIYDKINPATSGHEATHDFFEIFEMPKRQTTPACGTH
jgi:ring-1,2-phenylacetyl-CoA epoxidase subunit PaaB